MVKKEGEEGRGERIQRTECSSVSPWERRYSVE